MTHRRLLLASALTVFTCAGAYAADVLEPAPLLEPTGYFEKWFGGTFYNGDYQDDDTTDVFSSGGSGRVMIPWTDSVTTQSDLDVTYDFITEDDDVADDQFNIAGYGTGHLSWRDPESFLLGLFGGGGVTGFQDEDSANFFFIGLEGQAYFQNFTFYGQGGYLDSDQGNIDDDSFRNAWFARGVARWFPMETTRFQGEIGFAAGESRDGAGSDQDTDVISWGARLDHQFGGLPGIWFLGYRGHHFDMDHVSGTFDECSYTQHTVMVGWAYNFNHDTLQSNDRYGANLDTPDAGRIVGGGENLNSCNALLP